MNRHGCSLSEQVPAGGSRPFSRLRSKLSIRSAFRRKRRTSIIMGFSFPHKVCKPNLFSASLRVAQDDQGEVINAPAIASCESLQHAADLHHVSSRSYRLDHIQTRAYPVL